MKAMNESLNLDCVINSIILHITTQFIYQNNSTHFLGGATAQPLGTLA
jgi:hypothetical protein